MQVTGSLSTRLGCNLVMVRRHMAIEDSSKMRAEGQRQMRQLVRYRRGANAVQRERFEGMKEQEEVARREQRKEMMRGLAEDVDRTRRGKVNACTNQSINQ